MAIPQSRTPAPLQLVNWILRPLDYMETLFRRYGDLFLARWGVFEWVFVCHPDALKQVLTQDSGESITAPGEVNKILSPLLGQNSVIMLDGSAHRQRRKLIMPPFHGDRLKVYAHLIRDITHSVMAEMTQGQHFRARDVMQKITMRVILQAVFGLHEGERYRCLETLLAQRLNMLSSPVASTLVFFPILQTDLGSWSPGAKIARMSQEIDRLIYAEIQERRQSQDFERDDSGDDILSLLLLARDEQGQGLTDQELRDELMTLLVAGHETTATALAWSLYWSHHQPDIKTRIQAEIQQHNLSQDPVALTKLPYLNAVCQETLRIYPVAMLTFSRQLQQPLELMGHPLPAQTKLVGSIYLLHHREDLYPDSKQFRPERFLERQYSPFEFMPFGSGARRCVGAALALYELKIVLGTLLTEYDLALTTRQPVQPQRRGITLGMKGGVEMIYQGQHKMAVTALA